MPLKSRCLRPFFFCEEYPSGPPCTHHKFSFIILSAFRKYNILSQKNNKQKLLISSVSTVPCSFPKHDYGFLRCASKYPPAKPGDMNDYSALARAKVPPGESRKLYRRRQRIRRCSSPAWYSFPSNAWIVRISKGSSSIPP